MSAVETAIIGMGVIIGAGIVTWLTSSVILYARYGAPTISHFPQQDNSINVYGGYIIRDEHGWEQLRHDGKNISKFGYYLFIAAVLLCIFGGISWLIGSIVAPVIA